MAEVKSGDRGRMCAFDVGDQVVCVNDLGRWIPNGAIQIGKTYKVAATRPDEVMLEECPDGFWFGDYRFKHAVEKPKFERGDLVRCVDDSDLVVHGAIKRGSEYYIDEVIGGSIRLGLRWFNINRFVLAEQADVSDQEPAKETPDAVYQPAHYTQFVIEPITFINANGLSFNIGNVVKYACRYKLKNGLEDLRKARRYLDIQIECMEREARVKSGEDPKDVWKETL